MRNTKSPPIVTLLLSVLTLLAFGAASLHAEDVFVTAKIGTASGATSQSACPPSCTTNISTWGSSATSTATPVPVIPASSRKSQFGTAPDGVWAVTPTDIVQTSDTGTWTFQQCQNVNALYKVYVTKGGAIGVSASPDVIMTVTVDPSTTLFDPSDVGATTPLASLDTTAFQRSQPNDQWVLVCIISNTTPNPTVVFTHTGGTVSTTSGYRLYCDAARFQLIDPCADVTPQVSPIAPLAAGQTFVNVPVSEGATNVTVYANAAQIGITNYAAGFAAGTVVVPTTALVKGESITATQIKLNGLGNPCPSTPGAAGIVGGGPNATLTFFAGCYQNPDLAGPVGTNGAPGADVYYVLGATSLSYGQPPVGGKTLAPSTCWQEVTLQHGVDTAISTTSGGQVNNTDPYFALEGLVINQVDADTGPYVIYIDQIKSGDTVVEDFESYDTDSVSTFVAPSAAANPNAGVAYLPPNSSTISTANAYDGTKSCRIDWQWSTAGGRWANVLASGASGGKIYPQFDTSLPISFKILVLPVGSSSGTVFNGEVSAITNTTPIYQYGSVEMGVWVTGSATYSYEWESYDSGSQTWNPLYVTTRTCTVDPLPNTDTASYRVAVNDGGCTVYRTITLGLPVPVPVITNQPVSIVVNVGSPASICVGATPAPVASDMINYYQWYKIDPLSTNQIGAPVYPPPFGTGTPCLSEIIPSAQLTDTGDYQVSIQGTYGAVTTIVVSLQVVTGDIVIGNGDGLRGNYYNQPDFTGGAVPESWGAVDLSRVDPTVNFDWVLGSPDPTIQVDYFTARWYGQIQPLYSDTYTFTVRSDDGCRLWIDKQLVINDWRPKGATDTNGIITLDTTKHDILLEYFEQGGNASVKLYWTNNAGNISKTIVPLQQLFANQATWTPPAVTLTSPANGSTVMLPAQVSLAANVVTNDGIVASIEFYNGSTLITTVTTPPYSTMWSAPQGSYSVSAKVVYNESSKETSNVNTVTVNAPATQSVLIDSIVNNGNGTVTINYSGGSGASFTLMKTTDPTLARDSWTAVTPDEPATPGSFTITPAGNEFYLIRSN